MRATISPEPSRAAQRISQHRRARQANAQNSRATRYSTSTSGQSTYRYGDKRPRGLLVMEPLRSEALSFPTRLPTLPTRLSHSPLPSARAPPGRARRSSSRPRCSASSSTFAAARWSSPTSFLEALRRVATRSISRRAPLSPPPRMNKQTRPRSAMRSLPSGFGTTTCTFACGRR